MNEVQEAASAAAPMRRALSQLASLLLLPAVPAVASSSPSPRAAAGEEDRASTWLWAPVEAGGERPARRQGHAAVDVGHQVYIFGGCDQDTQCYNDLHVLDTDTIQWRKQLQGGNTPLPRSGHSAVLMSGGIVIFGGANTEETFADAHMLDLSTGAWQAVAMQGAAPTPRTNHAAAAGPRGCMYVFGGYDAGGFFLNELWSLCAFRRTSDGGTAPLAASWELVVPSGTVPAAVQGHSLTAVGQRLVLFGGYVAGSGASNDVHVFDPETRVWSQLQAVGPPPPPRQAHAAARHGNSVVLAGGCDTSSAQQACFNDIWSLSLDDGRWERRSAGFSGWMSREGHTSTFVRGRMFLFGGCQLAGDCYDDLLALETADPCPSACGGHGTCVGQQFCQCSEAGFTGHDCMQPLSCRQDCGPHGSCTQDGQCLCDAGWAGAVCSEQQELAADQPAGALGAAALGKCQRGCCGRGECTRAGCLCAPGWYGPMCAANKSIWEHIRLLDGARAKREQAGKSQALAQAMSRSTASGARQPAAVWAQVRQLSADAQALLAAAEATEREALPADNPSILAAVEEALECPLPQGAARRDGAAVALGQLGAAVDGGSAGSAGDATRREGASRLRGGPHVEDPGPGCDDMCNYEGVCREGLCYCRTGYTGMLCETKRQSQSGTMSLELALTFVFIFFFLCFIMTLLIMLCLNQRNKETDEGEYHFRK